MDLGEKLRVERETCSERRWQQGCSHHSTSARVRRSLCSSHGLVLSGRTSTYSDTSPDDAQVCLCPFAHGALAPSLCNEPRRSASHVDTQSRFLRVTASNRIIVSQMHAELSSARCGRTSRRSELHHEYLSVSEDVARFCPPLPRVAGDPYRKVMSLDSLRSSILEIYGEAAARNRRVPSKSRVLKQGVRSRCQWNLNFSLVERERERSMRRVVHWQRGCERSPDQGAMGYKLHSWVE
ncbi:hypothetical protein IE81DRAFT_232986 [Ceraceosorus guamensis]|uniref:Uncharacterized protein n=1 Tax=Ceraceosorus guamensis TaxID=1522189 RepID=A0A316VRV5_9BASI|nr:hypothetical protein IE81DRAFT_232986 [Ceraceosorus guamensis]PWN40336.1 hypothetical protein IE81DRAFT_232986 [Ceraceosorus guamensis]